LRFKKEDELIPFLGIAGDSDAGNGEFDAHVDLFHEICIKRNRTQISQIFTD
jgi:hypothetical protein